MRSMMTRAFGWAAACALALTPDPAMAATDTAADVARLQNEVEHLKQELADQRQLILQLMQAEQQRYDVVLKMLRSGGGAGADLPALPPPPSASAMMPKSAAGAGDTGKDGGVSGHVSATVTGKVRCSGGAIGEAYVYIDGLRSSARGHTIEVKQRDKQFAPRVLVVPLGTKLVFPNQDTVIHNVFSTAPGNSFDLGSVKGGETSPPVVLLKPGPVEIFCNIHSKMRADVLVVPNNHWTRVSADGSFSLSGVPVGSRKIVLWSPTLKPVSQQVDVTPRGGAVTFTSEAMSVRPHLNKRGQAYGSYDE
jgi:plastocyanin